MVNPHQYIEYLNTTGADIDLKPQPLKPSDLPDQLDKTQLKAHIAKGLPSIDTARIDDLPFKIKTDEWEWQEIKAVGKFPKNYKPDFLDFDYFLDYLTKLCLSSIFNFLLLVSFGTHCHF